MNGNRSLNARMALSMIDLIDREIAFIIAEEDYANHVIFERAIRALERLKMVLVMGYITNADKKNRVYKCIHRICTTASKKYHGLLD